jgi:hypothetical protein
MAELISNTRRTFRKLQTYTILTSKISTCTSSTIEEVRISSSTAVLFVVVVVGVAAAAAAVTEVTVVSSVIVVLRKKGRSFP